MKRLLAYLFIVLGLGLTFSVNAKADVKYNYCVPKNLESLYSLQEGQLIKTWWGETSVFNLKKVRFFMTKGSCSDTWNGIKYKGVSKDEFYKVKLNFQKRLKLIAKAEPSQTQNETSINTEDKVAKVGNYNCSE
jgi:hypothetical protein